jgi:aminopeptidase N
MPIQNRDKTILHELGHMWFGNQVSMEHWNDIFIKESITEFNCHLALLNIKEHSCSSRAWYCMQFRSISAYNAEENCDLHPLINNQEDN